MRVYYAGKISCNTPPVKKINIDPVTEKNQKENEKNATPQNLAVFFLLMNALYVSQFLVNCYYVAFRQCADFITIMNFKSVNVDEMKTVSSNT